MKPLSYDDIAALVKSIKRLRKALRLAIKCLEHTDPAPEGWTQRVINDCKQALKRK